MTTDLRDPRAIHAKGGLFLAAGLLASGLLVAEHPTAKVVGLLSVAIWSFSRFYYYAFYVITHYVDPSYRFSGLCAFARYLIGRAAEESPDRHRSPDAFERRDA